jgi:hypothetical protein
VISTGALSGAKIVRWSGALLLIEGLTLETVLRVIRNDHAGVRVRGGRLIVLMAGGAVPVVDVGIWMLSGTEF